MLGRDLPIRKQFHLYVARGMNGSFTFPESHAAQNLEDASFALAARDKLIALILPAWM